MMNSMVTHPQKFMVASLLILELCAIADVYMNMDSDLLIVIPLGFVFLLMLSLRKMILSEDKIVLFYGIVTKNGDYWGLGHKELYWSDVRIQYSNFRFSESLNIINKSYDESSNIAIMKTLDGNFKQICNFIHLNSFEHCSDEKTRDYIRRNK